MRDKKLAVLLNEPLLIVFRIELGGLKPTSICPQGYHRESYRIHRIETANVKILEIFSSYLTGAFGRRSYK
jgi:hypothetical protein